ncbi:MAG: heme ABC transporter permease [Alphaproteobacteria bacterium]|nr:heme ABC transporter permease [Alphaproteobacteria bacterium]
MHFLANPGRFLRLSAAFRPWLAGLAAVAIAAGLYLGLFEAPPDYQQGDTVRIMFVHVPSAWLALSIYTAMTAFALMSLVWRHPVADLLAKACAPVGAAFTLTALATGSLWGKPMWGAWWVWDARLTSVLVLFFLYLGAIALRAAHDDPERGGKAAGILTLVGFVNVPIIKFSVDWWNTLHQPASVLKAGGPAIHASILTPLLVMALGFSLFAAWTVLVRAEAEIFGRRARVLELKRSADRP